MLFRSGEPVPREPVIRREVRKLVPFVIDSVNDGLVGPQEFVLELEIIRRVGEDQIDGLFRQRLQDVDATALEDGIERAGWFFRPKVCSVMRSRNQSPLYASRIKTQSRLPEIAPEITAS